MEWSSYHIQTTMVWWFHKIWLWGFSSRAVAFAPLLIAISMWIARGVAWSPWQMIPRKLSLNMPIACSESHSGSGDPKLSDIYSVIIPTVKEIQVENQWIFLGPSFYFELLKLCEGAIEKFIKHGTVHNKYITTLIIYITVYISLLANNNSIQS